MKNIVNVIICLSMMIFSTGTAFSQTIEAITTDGKKVILNPDGSWKYREQTTLLKAQTAAEAVTIWKIELQRDDTEYQQKVGLHINYQNNTEKKIIGVVTQVEIKNPFGKTVLKDTYEDEVAVEPLEKLENQTYWSYTDNPYISDEIYDRLWQITDNGTAKITAKVIKVIFMDGSSLKNKDSKK